MDPSHQDALIPGIARIARENKVIGSMWEIWQSLHSKPRAQQYLMALASGRYTAKSIMDVRSDLGMGVNQVYAYRSAVPGFEEMEYRLLTEPATAAQWLAVVHLPLLVGYWSRVIEGEEPGDKQEAARMLAHVADPSLRKTAQALKPEKLRVPKTAKPPEAVDPNKPSVAESFLSRLGDG